MVLALAAAPILLLLFLYLTSGSYVFKGGGRFVIRCQGWKIRTCEDLQSVRVSKSIVAPYVAKPCHATGFFQTLCHRFRDAHVNTLDLVAMVQEALDKFVLPEFHRHLTATGCAKWKKKFLSRQSISHRQKHLLERNLLFCLRSTFAGGSVPSGNYSLSHLVL